MSNIIIDSINIWNEGWFSTDYGNSSTLERIVGPLPQDYKKFLDETDWTDEFILMNIKINNKLTEIMMFSPKACLEVTSNAYGEYDLKEYFVPFGKISKSGDTLLIHLKNKQVYDGSGEEPKDGPQWGTFFGFEDSPMYARLMARSFRDFLSGKSKMKPLYYKVRFNKQNLKSLKQKR